MPKSMNKIIRGSTLWIVTLAATTAAAPVVRAQEQPATADSASSKPAAVDEKSFDDLLSGPAASGDPKSSAAEPPAASDDAPSQSSAAATASAGNTPQPAAPSPSTAKGDGYIPVKGSEETAESPTKRPPHSRQIDEIVITATKREESIRDIPQSITAFTGESLEGQGKMNLFDFVQESPGVVAAQGSSGFTRVTMRGITTDSSPYAGNSSPVGFFIGDVSFNDPYIANIIPDLSAFDLSGVQVLKGPQGTLFGGQALSGAIRYELQEPVLGEWQVRGFSQYTHPMGGSSAYTSGAAINMPVLKDSLALRIAYVDRNYPGVTDDLRTGKQNVDHGSGNQIRVIALWKPLDDLKLKATHLTQKFFSPYVLLADNPSQHTNKSVVAEEPSANHFSMDSLDASYDFNTFRIVSLTSYISKFADFTGDDTAVIAGNPPANYPASAAALSRVVDISHALSNEIRVQSTGSGPFQWLAGLYRYNYHGFFSIDIDTPLTQSIAGNGSLIGNLGTALGLPTSLITNNTPILLGISNAKSYENAFFMNLSYKFWDRLDLAAGVRLYETAVTGGFIGSGVLILAENNGMDSNTTNTIKEKGVNPKLTATFNFTDDISIYAQAAKGFRFGGIQDVPSTPTNGVPPTFKSDTIWNYEIGLRTSWLDNTLHADITPLYIQYKNPIISQTTQGIPIGYSDNVSSAISRGLETSLLWNTPLDGFTVSAQGSLTDAHITAPFTAANGTKVQPGQELPGAARYQYSTSASYLRPVWIALVGGNVGYTYIGKGFNDITHDVVINGYGTLNAGLTLSSPIPLHPTLNVNFNNILNTTKPNAAVTGTALTQASTYGIYTLNPPRTLSVRLSLSF